MREFLLLRLEGPLQAWGDVAIDGMRPIRPFPPRSAIAGLLSSAMGWRHTDGRRTTALQDALTMAVRIDRAGQHIVDYQTAELAETTSGWTHWGIEYREIGNVVRAEQILGRPPRERATQQLWKSYTADASFLVAVGLTEESPVTIDLLESALTQPARPLYLGRRSCPPSTALLEGRVTAKTPGEALANESNREAPYWFDASDEPLSAWTESMEIWDRRDFESGQFLSSRVVRRGLLRRSTDS